VAATDRLSTRAGAVEGARPAERAVDRFSLRCDSVEHVFGKGRGTTRALGGVSFSVRHGTVVGLLGPNGAGKTTVIELVCGLRALQGGTIRLFEEGLPAGDPATRHRIGYLPQKSVLYEDVSVEANMRFVAELHRCPHSRVDEVLKLVGLEDRRQSLAGALSGGMQRRLAIARALVHEPELLVLDEPTLGVDSDNRHRIWQYVRAVRHAGTGVLLSTNYLDEVEALCDQVVVLDKGRLVALVRPGDLLRRAGWWVEVECEAPYFEALARSSRQLGALEVVLEEPMAKLRFADAQGAREAMSRLVGNGPATAVRERRPDLVEIFASLRDGR